MRAISVAIDVLQECEQLRLILVQFSSPFARESERSELLFQDDQRGSRFEWKHQDHINHRVSRFWSTLANVKDTGLLGSIPTLIAFPEYAIPKECHKGLQDFADQNKCIIVPGSYYESESTDPLFKSNVCSVYAPKQPLIQIVKRHGFQVEQHALVSNDAPNIAHLIGNNKIIKQFSISVAICRDYILPYTFDSNQRYVSLLDWTNPGLNLVVMCSSQMSLFEYRAAFDVRGLPGPRRITALCNCSGIGFERKDVVGSAIMGPREDPDSGVGDIIESLRGDEEGVIFADIFLNNPDLARVEWKPDKHVFVPVRRAEKFRISDIQDGSGKPAIELHQIKEPGPTERGVWHPAFLQHIQRQIVMHLFTTRHYERLKEAIENKQINGVSAFAVEGKHDILFRYYKSSETRSDFLDTHFATLSRRVFEQIVDLKSQAAIVVAPENIIKFRTVAVDKRDWEDRRRKIEELIPLSIEHVRRRELLERISRLSRDWNDQRVTPAERDEVSAVFLGEREHVPPISAYETGRTNLREKFVLISVGGPDESKRKQFELEIINHRLLPLDAVRSIYRINQEVDGYRFDYWVDVFAEPWKIAEIVLGISSWGNSLDLETGTRTMEVLKFLLLESVEGIHATDYGREITMFLYEARRINEEILSDSSAEVNSSDAVNFLRKCGMAWYAQHGAAEGPQAVGVRRNISTFYAYLFFGNIAKQNDIKELFLKNAAAAWWDVYKQLEQQFEDILRKRTACGDDGEVWPHAKDYLTKLGAKEVELNAIHTSPVELVFQLARHDGDFNFTPPPPAKTISEITRIYKGLVKFRNRMTHGRQELIYLQLFPTPKRGDGWKIDQITEITAALISLLNAGNRCLNAMTPKS